MHASEGGAAALACHASASCTAQVHVLCIAVLFNHQNSSLLKCVRQPAACAGMGRCLAVVLTDADRHSTGSLYSFFVVSLLQQTLVWVASCGILSFERECGCGRLCTTGEAGAAGTTHVTQAAQAGAGVVRGCGT